MPIALPLVALAPEALTIGAAGLTALGLWYGGKAVYNASQSSNPEDQSQKAQEQAGAAAQSQPPDPNCNDCKDKENKKRENKKKHLFDKSEHNFDNFLKSFDGNQNKALDALQNAANKIGQGSSGRFSGVADINGYSVTIRGAIVNGQAEIGTAFIP